MSRKKTVASTVLDSKPTDAVTEADVLGPDDPQYEACRQAELQMMDLRQRDVLPDPERITVGETRKLLRVRDLMSPMTQKSDPKMFDMWDRRVKFCQSSPAIQKFKRFCNADQELRRDPDEACVEVLKGRLAFKLDRMFEEIELMPLVEAVRLERGEEELAANQMAPTNEKWVTRAMAAKISGANPGTITKAVQKEKLKTNGEAERALRIDRVSLTLWMEQRVLRPEPIESDAAVLAKLKRIR